MGCLLGVAQGSEQPPAFIVLEHAPQGAQEKPMRSPMPCRSSSPRALSIWPR
jgi:hypothetical protein